MWEINVDYWRATVKSERHPVSPLLNEGQEKSNSAMKN